MVLSAAVEGKNRPVATNFQFLKMLCPSGTALLQRSRVFEVFLLGRACPKPCWNEYGKLEVVALLYFCCILIKMHSVTSAIVIKAPTKVK